MKVPATRNDRRRFAAGAALRALLAAGLACGAPARAASAHVITIDATVISKNSCSFSTASSSIDLTIDPSGSSAVTGTDPLVLRCVGSANPATYSITNGSGLHGSSPSALRMQDTANPSAYLAYALSYPASGSTPKNTSTTLTVTASVSPSAYRSAPSGTYSDSVVLTISP